MSKGRKTKYNPQIVQKICDLIQEDSYTIPEICKQVGISKATFLNWKKEKLDFLDSIKRAEELQLSNLTRIARNSMKRKLEGYTYEETKTTGKKVKVGKNKDGIDIYQQMITEKIVTEKHITPSDTMIIFHLKNKDPENYGEDKEDDRDFSDINFIFPWDIDNDETDNKDTKNE